MFHRTVERSQGLRLFDRARGTLETLVPAADAPLAGAFDPEARHLIYCSEAGGTRHLRVLDLASRETRTVDLGSPACFPRWSPDGQQIAFLLWQNDHWQVATAASDGSGVRVWTDGMPELHGMNAPIDWSPDGKRLVFKSDTRAFESDLFVLELASGEIRNVTRDAWFDEAPAFSRDGNALIFMSTRGGNWTWGLFRLSLQDERVEPITKADYEEKNYPRMGPGGDIVWTTVDEHGVEWLVEQDGSGAVRVLRSAGAGARWATYSPDGQKLLFPLLEKTVEYWIVEHPLGAGSPLAEPPPPGPAAPAPTRASPVDKHRR
jgi:TolB protein